MSATLETISRTPGYPDGASSDGSMFAIVTTAKNPRIPTTTNTMRLWTRATTVEPMTFTAVIAITTRTAKAFAQLVFSFVNMALA